MVDEEKVERAKEGVSIFVRLVAWITDIVRRRRGK